MNENDELWVELRHEHIAKVIRVWPDPGFENVRVYRMNPKSITMNQLYGAFDLQTGEWTDGIGAVLIRHISQPNTEETGVQQDDHPLDLAPYLPQISLRLPTSPLYLSRTRSSGWSSTARSTPSGSRT